MIVVTRHSALIELLRERGIVSGNVRVIKHATVADVQGQHVVGVLPLELAAMADRVTVVPLHLAPEDRGHELSLARLREIAQPARTYVVRDITDPKNGVQA